MTRLEVFGWVAFLLSGVAFLISGVNSEDPVVIAGSGLFVIGVLAILLSQLRH